MAFNNTINKWFFGEPKNYLPKSEKYNEFRLDDWLFMERDFRANWTENEK